jgi:hypothetical protein
MISLIADHSIAQTSLKGKYSFLRAGGSKKERSINLGKKERKTEDLQTSLLKHFFNTPFQPELSVDLLDGSGIHLFTISDIDLIPTIRVGARIKAGLKITI